MTERFPRLAERVPWTAIGQWPTPVYEAKKFASRHGLKALYVKREDLSHPVMAGNKVRGLEFLLGEARRRGARTIVTFSAEGSHHICKTAWHARQLGIDTVAVVVPQAEAPYVRENVRVAESVGARYVGANYATVVPKVIAELLSRRNRREGRRPYYVPPGGTSPLACLGHVGAALELKRQVEAGELPEPDYLYVALGSLGTAAGLAVGLKLAGLRTQLVGVVVSYRWYCTRGRWARMARRVNRLMRRMDESVPRVAIRAAELRTVGTALGAGYARATPEATALAAEFGDLEGIALDQTYTAKALHGAMQFIARGGWEERVHLFWHTYQGWKAGGELRMANGE
ncbi:MAG TPA: pyridoxal-phosphate dependent enzyme [Phycisphaerae bacterium]|nr:pyridoxal-phosphate dependent enzyme [Phycisphaerae bacterium]